MVAQTISGPKGVFIHPLADVEPGAHIGDGSRIWRWTHISRGADIGEDCVIGQCCEVGPNVTIGNRCKIQNNVSVYYGVTLEDEVFCGPSMVFTNVKYPRAGIEKKSEFLETRICFGAEISANVTIVCGTTIGRHAFIAAGAVVTKNVRDYALMAGVPARQIGWAGRFGEPLVPDGPNAFVCPRTGERYELVDG